MAHHLRADVSHIARYGRVRAALAVMMSVCVPAVIQACPICFQVDDSPVVGGVRAAVGVLIGVTTVVLAGFGVFAARFIRRSRELNQ